MAISSGDAVVVEYTGRLDDGTVFDTTREAAAEEAGLTERQPDREYGPVTLEVGTGEIIEGLEEALTGMEPGDEDTVTVPPEDAYGDWTDEQVREYDPEEFSEMVGGEAAEEGAYLQTQEGGLAEVTHVDEEVVRVDFNHPLAGETLEFDLEVVDVN